MLSFEPITIENALRLHRAFRCQPYRACDYTVGAVYQWRDYFSSAVAFVGDTAILSADYPNEGRYAMFPIGCKNVSDALDALDQMRTDRGEALRFAAVPDAALELLKARYGDRLRYETYRDWADYLYTLSDLQTFPGKRFHGQKNHLNRFKKLYPNSRLVPITEETLPNGIAFLDALSEKTEAGSEMETVERRSARELLEAAIPLGLKAAYLETADGEIAALSVGEVVCDTLYVHVEKADLRFSGAYQAIVSLFSQYAAEADTLYINREDDSGEEGLRRSKESYHPIALINKHWVTIP